MNRLGFRAARSYNTFNLRDERSLWSCEEHAAIGTLKFFGEPHYRRLCSYRVPRQLPSVKSRGTRKKVLTECQHSENINTR